jgi:hypothetical protein
MSSFLPARPAGLLSAVLGFLLLAWTAAAAEPKPIEDKVKEVAGTAEFLRSVPKHFATLKGIDRARRRVTLQLDGEAEPKAWPLADDAEVKRAGWWARLDQMRVGDRVWVWLQLDRVGQPVAVSMLCDELSEQDIHGPGVPVTSAAPGRLVLKPSRGGGSNLGTEGAEFYRGKDKAPLASVRPGEKLYVQSGGGRARLVLDPAAFEARRAEQKAALRQRWLDEGLPGTVTFLHPFSGEMELVLDHEAMGWGRALRPGDQVTIRAEPSIPAVVKWVKPWRERTQLRLVVRGADQADLSLGRRVQVRVPAPPPEVEAAALPPDLDRPRGKEERVEWFLASIYCTCKVPGDGCTGHFYTLASCNVNGCGMPNHMRKVIAAKIDKGMTDRQILEELLKEQGPGLLKPHLMP